MREAPENVPSKVRLTWMGPKGVLKRAPRGIIATALSIWSMMDTKRVSSLIRTWGDRRQAFLLGCCAHPPPLVQGPLHNHLTCVTRVWVPGPWKITLASPPFLPIKIFSFFKLVIHTGGIIFKTTKKKKPKNAVSLTPSFAPQLPSPGATTDNFFLCTLPETYRPIIRFKCCLFCLLKI